MSDAPKNFLCLGKAFSFRGRLQNLRGYALQFLDTLIQIISGGTFIDMSVLSAIKRFNCLVNLGLYGVKQLGVGDINFRRGILYKRHRHLDESKRPIQCRKQTVKGRCLWSREAKLSDESVGAARLLNHGLFQRLDRMNRSLQLAFPFIDKSLYPIFFKGNSLRLKQRSNGIVKRVVVLEVHADLPKSLRCRLQLILFSS